MDNQKDGSAQPEKILTRWQKGLQDIAWNSLYWEIMTSKKRFPFRQ